MTSAREWKVGESRKPSWIYFDWDADALLQGAIDLALMVGNRSAMEQPQAQYPDPARAQLYG